MQSNRSHSSTPHSPCAEGGVTLIELMITVLIIAALASVALPTYERYVQQTHRSNAKNALLQVAQWMERAATAQGSYPLTANVAPGVLKVEGARYVVTVVSNDGQTYLATATAQGTQVNDACGNFTLNQSGARGVTGSLPASECWER